MASKGALAGQKALVTGANSGIGAAVAVALGRAGADVVVNYVVNDDAAQAVVQDIQKGGVNAITIKADVSVEDQVVRRGRGVVLRRGGVTEDDDRVQARHRRGEFDAGDAIVVQIGRASCRERV